MKVEAFLPHRDPFLFIDEVIEVSNEKIVGGLVQNPDLDNNDLVGNMPEGKVTNYAFRNESNFKFKDVSKDWGLNYLGFSLNNK